jgi:hypothetical protein
MMDEAARKAIVESGDVWLADGLRAWFAGRMNPYQCSVISARAGLWACTWETAAAVCARPDRRFLLTDFLWGAVNGWLGVRPGPEDYQTPADWERAQAKEQQTT